MPQKISFETLSVESPDVLWAMRTTLKTSSEQVQLALTFALLAACSVNLILVCVFL
jgi:hypothetical protein